MTLILAIVSSLLSISQTNEYHFIRLSTNLTGKTYMLSGGIVPRYEDIAFLKEAYLERNAEIFARTNSSLYVVSDVPNSQLMGDGDLFGGFAPKAFFAPSFGMWGGYSRYNTGFFLKPGVNITTDFSETSSDFKWTNGHDTSYTNSIEAFVDSSSVCIDTNLIHSVHLKGIVEAKNIVSAYANITNRFNVLSFGECYSHQNNRTTTHYSHNADLYDFVSTPYTYNDWKGRTYSSQYISGFSVRWEDSTSVSTNVSPSTPSSYLVRSDKTTGRYVVSKMTYKGQTSSLDTYDIFMVGDPYRSVDSYDNMNGSGNMLAKFENNHCGNDTNGLADVKCFVVIRFKCIRNDFYYNYQGAMASTPDPISYTNYFVAVETGNASPTETFSDGKRVWDSGVCIIGAIRDIVSGYGYFDWVGSANYPTLDGPMPETYLAAGEQDATHCRYLWIYIDSVYPYFYYRKKWNARVKSIDP